MLKFLIFSFSIWNIAFNILKTYFIITRSNTFAIKLSWRRQQRKSTMFGCKLAKLHLILTMIVQILYTKTTIVINERRFLFFNNISFCCNTFAISQNVKRKNVQYSLFCIDGDNQNVDWVVKTFFHPLNVNVTLLAYLTWSLSSNKHYI